MVKNDEIRNAYLKLKSDIYYSNNMHYKNMIAEFEYNGNIEQTFKSIKEIYNDDMELLNKLINKINVFILPKSIGNNEQKVNGIKDTSYIESVNFFIDAPIEIFIIDALWTLKIGKVCYFNNILNTDLIYGNVLSNCKLYDIGVNNGTFFEPYFYKYKSWRDKAFKYVLLNNEKSDTILINWDIKQYYYNYQVDFDELYDYLKLEKKIDYKIINKIYKKYSSIIKQYKELKNYKNRYPLPIGLNSSRIIGNIVLSKYDTFINSTIKENEYYGRYVDDMLLVYTLNDGLSKSDESEIAKEFIDEKFKLLKKVENKYYISKDHLSLNGKQSNIELEINSDKIDFYYFKKNTRNNVIKIFESKILNGASDIGFYIDEPIDENKIISELLKNKNSTYINKISEIKDTSIDKYELSLMLTKLIALFKNVTITNNKTRQIGNILVDFLSNGDGIKFHKQWEKIFILLNLIDQELSEKYFNDLKSYIENKMICKLNEIENFKNIDKLIENLKNSLMNYLEYSFSIGKSFLDLKKNIKTKWEISMMIKKNLIDKPLYILRETQISDYIYGINENKKKYLPYMISLEDLNLYFSLQSIFDKKTVMSLDGLIDVYCDLNGITKEALKKPKGIDQTYNFDIEFMNHQFESVNENGKIEVVLLNQITCSNKGLFEDKSNYDERFVKFVEDSSNYDEYKIGIVSIPLSEEMIEKNVEKMTYMDDLSYKLTINKILNEAIKNRVDHLIFPELSIPITWIKDVMFFSRRHRIQVTFGLQFLYDNLNNSKKKIANCIVSIYPFVVGGVHKLMFFDMREKKYYTMKEKKMFKKNKFKYNNGIKRDSKIVSYRNGKFTNMLCFELTSIKDRASLENCITNLFVPVLNKDTNYFSSIITSSARELYCYISVANTSIYGDSRITGPLKTDYKDIVRLKGGKNIYLAVGKVNINNLNKYKNLKEFNTKNIIYKPACAGESLLKKTKNKSN